MLRFLACAALCAFVFIPSYLCAQDEPTPEPGVNVGDTDTLGPDRPIGEDVSPEREENPLNSPDTFPKHGADDTDVSSKGVDSAQDAAKALSAAEEQVAFASDKTTVQDGQRVLPQQSTSKSMWQLVITFVVMLGALIGGLMLLKRYMPGFKEYGGNRVIEVVSRVPISPKQSLHLVRLSNRMLLIGVSPERMDMLTEIDSKEDIEILLANRQISAPHSATHSFKSLFKSKSDHIAAAREENARRRYDGEEELRSELDQIKGRIAAWKAENSL